MPTFRAQVDWSNTDPTDSIEQINAMPETPETFPERIEACRRVLELVQREERPEQWGWLHAEIGFCSIKSVGTADDNLRQSIVHYEKALEVYTSDVYFKEWLSASRNLARAYKRWIGGDRAENLERAIQLQEGILQTCPPERFPKTWAQTHVELAYLYLHRIQGNKIPNLEQALTHYQHTLEIWDREAFPIRWAKVHYSMGTTMSRLQRLGENWKTYQKQTITCFEKALEVLTQEAFLKEWIKVQHNLGLAYAECRQGDRAHNLKQAIERLDAVSKVCQRENLLVEWAKAQNALGIAYFQSTHGGRSENVERAIGYFQQALKMQEKVGPAEQKALTQHNLSAAYTDRLLKDRTENLRQAVVYGQAALDTINQCKYTSSDWAMIKTGLVGALWKLAMNLGQQGYHKQAADHLENAIKHGKKVVSALEKQPLPYWQAFVCYNLANAYSDRVEGSQAKNQERAVEYYNRALEFFTKENSPDRWANAHSDLGITYLEYSGSKWVGGIEKAIDHFNKALEVFNPDTFPISTLRVARNLGNLYFNVHRWQDAVEPYRQALDATERLYRFSVLRVGKEAEIGETADLYRHNAYALACSGDLKGAVVAMERGRARLLSEALQRDYADLETLKISHPNLHRLYRQAASEIVDLARMEPSSGDQPSITNLAIEMRKARHALDQVVETIRQIPGYEDFLTLPKFDDVVKAIHPDVPLVYIVATPAGGLVLVVHSTGEITPLWLDALTEDSLRKHVQGQADAVRLEGYLGYYTRWRQSPNDPAARAAWFAALDDTTHWLWDALMGTLVQTLTDLDIIHATLIPQGYLGLLPLHAAWIEANGKRRYALDSICLTYAPNARALSAARQTAARVPPNRLFAVDEPQPVSANPLPNANAEVFAACEHFTQRKVLAGEAATEQAVRDQLSHHSVLHFSCHGRANFAQPLDSGLLMAHDQTLTLRDILALRLENARLAVLSACETGIPGIELPDEVISLPTGLAQAGIAGVVASLWSVSDSSTMMLMTRFYELWKGDGLEPPEALRQAQFWVRDTTNGQKAEYFKSFLPEFSGERMPVHVADTLYKASILARPDENDFEHPFYWAAFTYTGA